MICQFCNKDVSTESVAVQERDMLPIYPNPNEAEKLEFGRPIDLVPGIVRITCQECYERSCGGRVGK